MGVINTILNSVQRVLEETKSPYGIIVDYEGSVYDLDSEDPSIRKEFSVAKLKEEELHHKEICYGLVQKFKEVDYFQNQSPLITTRVIFHDTDCLTYIQPILRKEGHTFIVCYRSVNEELLRADLYGLFVSFQYLLEYFKINQSKMRLVLMIGYFDLK